MGLRVFGLSNWMDLTAFDCNRKDNCLGPFCGDQVFSLDMLSLGSLLAE